jgi:hypothetical protein
VPNLKQVVKPKGHLIESRSTEIAVGLLVFIFGCILLWDAFDGRGKKMPWPAGGIMPW